MMYFLIFVIRTFLKQDKEIAIYTSLDNFAKRLDLAHPNHPQSH